MNEAEKISESITAAEIIQTFLAQNKNTISQLRRAAEDLRAIADRLETYANHSEDVRSG